MSRLKLASARCWPRVLVGAALLWASGCASLPGTSDVADPFPPLREATLGEVLASYDAYCNAIETFSASGDLAIRDSRRGRTGQLQARVVAARGGRLYLKASVAIVTGIEVVSDGEQFWFQVPSKEKVWTGRSDIETDPGETGEPYYALRPADVTAALVPEPMAPREGQTLLFSGDRENFHLTLSRSGERLSIIERRVSLTREELRPFRLETFDEAGDLVADVVWRDWRDGTPREITIVRPLDGYFVRFDLRKVQTNVRVAEEVFVPRIPDDYEVIEVES